MTAGESIPAISIRQPWAELILRGRKKIEIRTWESDYRGKIYLHTGKVPDGYRALEFGMENVFRGGYVGIFELAAIIPFTAESWENWREQHLSDGQYHTGLFAWIIRNPKRFANPIPANGQLRIYHPERDIMKVLESTQLLS